MSTLTGDVFLDGDVVGTVTIEYDPTVTLVTFLSYIAIIFLFMIIMLMVLIIRR